MNRRICTCMWIIFTVYQVTASPPKFLFTVPRYLWQGTTEEFCISFHDDGEADFTVSLLIIDQNFQLGNGTANGEGKVCHQFIVPDKTGNGQLTLFIDSNNTDGNVSRAESVNVSIQESSLETFIQTDKPMYKPGETVKFRAMTVNRNLKPWIGMIPLVTVKNPSDVRVMQWKDVENRKGLLSFEMPLSKDPTLGEWQITMIVEGKEQNQPFKVEEYVLPKYEVTITAPTFLLPTTETIEGQVCAKYTYGKPVKGRVQLSVCFVDISPYYQFYRSEKMERPCATRIMDINGCEAYSVEGSELMLSSSNFSRYGNLVIDATVTEQATGIALNGTIEGPEMTFTAVNMRFEDDTHGYFKAAFPYYARVIVTKPDGSPAPGEEVEIFADNYIPDFHLKRNFKSDEHGVIKFAIKNLPKDVSQLSFTAIARKNLTAYDRSSYVISMYDTHVSHKAKMWFSPSNSYIHIPAVEGQLKCGSVAEFDILYSTPPDTDYKFFVQVLSKSHMVHHTHVRHHFKIHDAVNFDNIPDDMLLDPHTPPRPSYWPIDRIPFYDDPELGFSPEDGYIRADVKDLNSNDTTETGGRGEGEDEPCNLLAVLACAQPMREVGQQSVKEMCRVFNTFEECITPHRDNCENESNFKSLATMEDTYMSMCKNMECDVIAVSKCMEQIASITNMETTEEICDVYQELKECVIPHQLSCVKTPDVMKSVRQVVDTYDKICPEIPVDNEDNDTDLMCFLRHQNIAVILSSLDRVSASNTPHVAECATACTEKPECRGFIYKHDGSGTCVLVYKIYDPFSEEGVDYYERICYRDKSKGIIKLSHVGKVRISVPVTANMGPNSQLLVYYVRGDEEIVAATVTFKVERCFDNKVEMKFNRETVYPGNDVKLNVKASPGSICSVGVVDKSINLLAGNHQLTKEKIFGRFTVPYRYTSYWQEDKKYCDRKTHFDDALYSQYDYGYSRRYDFDVVDAVEAFRKMNLLVISDLTLRTRPCIVRMEYNFLAPLPFYTRVRGPLGSPASENIPDAFTTEQNVDNEIPQSDATKRKTRTHFPETWLWDLYIIGDDGEIEVDTTIPHTITEWVGNSLCTSTDVGVGVSPMTGITAFQPFFLSFTLPYSAVRGETVPVLVTIFNYMSECLVMQVALPRSKDFGIEGSGRSSLLRCVCPGESNTIKYHVIPYTLGKIKILATAESIPDDGTCGNQVVSLDGTGANDAVERELLIEAEGIEKEYTASNYICPEGTVVTEDMVLPLPSENLVDDSARGYINVIGDIMGPALSNLQDLLQMPYGCGEQNMASFSPNIFALQYLTNTNQLLPKIEKEAKSYMRIGYQRQLKYRHSDGSYSAFGGDGSGSIWLTAFVVKCFGQSRPYVTIDDTDLENSISWFRRSQLENGCFPKIGYTHSYYLKGGFSDRNNEASLTAFVLIAMLEAGIPRNDRSIVNAVHCLDVQDIPDTYTLSLMAYAYTLYDIHHHHRQHVMRKLEERATVEDGMKFWARTEVKDKKEKKKWYYSAVSAEVEMTAYALLAHITGEQQNAALNARSIVMWLTKQRNPRGGFSSTQDTIVALQALARYATLVYQGGVNVTVEMTENDSDGMSSTKFHIDDDNTLVLQSAPINKLPSTLKAEVGGIGCAMVQANVKYNVFETPTSPTFEMVVKVYRAKDNVNHCAKRTLNICVRFTGPGGVSNMAIVDVKMVTGWMPDENSLKKMIVEKKNPAYIGVEKYEVDGSYVHIYFDKLDSQRRCFLIDVDQNIELRSPKPAQVKVYDYYETDFTLIRNYDIKTTCGTKEELPYISTEEYYSGRFDDFPVQMRVPVLPPRLEGGAPSGVTTTTSCPRCYSNYDSTSKDFGAMVCGSVKIYKVQTGRKGKYSLKIYANVRTKKKEQVKKFVEQKLNSSCKCKLLSGKRGKILVFSDKDTFNRSNRTLTFNSSTKIVKGTKALEKAVWRQVRRKKC